MEVDLQANSTTSPGVRTYVQESGKSVSELATELGVSQTTIRRWLGSNTASSGSHAPKHFPSSLSAIEERLVCELRNRFELPIDDIVAVMRHFVNAKLSRSAIYRCLKRNGLARRPTPDTAPARGTEQADAGVIRIDVIDLPAQQRRKCYAFVAVDEATRDIYLEIRNKRDGTTAAGFLKRFLTQFHDPVRVVFTGDGSEFTDRFAVGKRNNLQSDRHPFGRLCAQHGIRHRFTAASESQAKAPVKHIASPSAKAVSSQPKRDAANRLLSAPHPTDVADRFAANFKRTYHNYVGYLSSLRSHTDDPKPDAPKPNMQKEERLASPVEKQLSSPAIERQGTNSKQKTPMGSMHRYALALWLLGAAVYGVSTQTFLRSVDLFRQDGGSIKASADQAAMAVGDLSPREDAKADEQAAKDASNAGATNPDTASQAATSEQSTPSSANTPEPETADGEWVQISAAVNMRTGPSSSARILKVQQLGTKLRVISRDGGWVEVLEPETDQKGWLFERYAKPIEPPALNGRTAASAPDSQGTQPRTQF